MRTFLSFNTASLIKALVTSLIKSVIKYVLLQIAQFYPIFIKQGAFYRNYIFTNFLNITFIIFTPWMNILALRQVTRELSLRMH